ncbi:MAG: hypothetical protein WC607_03810 [Candidatus Micrarchaeia archaeon]
MTDEPTPTEPNADEAKKKRDLSEKEARELAKKNRERIDELRETMSTSSEARRKRDEENAKVKEYKEKRLAAETEVDKVKTELDEKKEKLRLLVGDSKMPFEKLQREIEELEWIQQTEATSAKRERELSKQINDLRKQLPSSEEAKKLYTDVGALRERLSKLNAEARDNRKLMEEHARESDVHHNKHLAAYKSGKALQEKISSAMGVLDVKRGEADAANGELAGIQRKKRDEESQEYEKERRETRAKETEIKHRVELKAKDILEKFRSGEKLSMEEFLILKESGLM